MDIELALRLLSTAAFLAGVIGSMLLHGTPVRESEGHVKNRRRLVLVASLIAWVVSMAVAAGLMMISGENAPGPYIMAGLLAAALPVVVLNDW